MKVEFLTKDILEDDFAKTLKPVLFLQTMMGWNRIEVVHKFVTLRPRRRFLPYLWLAFHLGVFYNVVYKALSTSKFDISMRSSSRITVTGALLLSHIETMLVTRLQKVLVITELQSIDRNLALQRQFYNRQLRRNIFSIAAFGGIISVSALAYTIFISNEIFRPIVVILIITKFDSEMYACGIYLDAITERLRELHFVLLGMQSRGKGRIATQNGNEESCEKLLVVYEKIIKAFVRFKNCYKFQVLLYWSVAIISLLELVQMLINSIKDSSEVIIHIYPVPFFIEILFRITCALLALCLVSQRFVNTVNEVNFTCLSLLIDTKIGSSRRLAKRMYLLRKAYNPSFSAYGIFLLDTKLMITGLGLVTTHTIVLLQFAFK